ncbi:MAG: acetylornithine deacetylase [Azonexus sp.]
MASTATQLQFSADQQKWYEAACEKLDPERLKQLLATLIGIHSPTGAARNIAEFMSGYLSSVGMVGSYRPMNEKSGNVLGELKGSGGGASVLLYSPLDTHLEGGKADYPWVGPEGFVDLVPEAKVIEDWVYGLGASNPKAMIATLVEVATALIEAGVPLRGDLMFAAADGGMPVNVPDRDNAGMSNGVIHMLNRGVAPDYAVIMKPWNFVYHEEPGMAWFKLCIHGTFGYAGIPRGTPGFRSSITPAAKVITELEKWIIEYAERNTSGVIKPHGWISAIRSGDPQRPAFPPAVTEIFFDVRINPRTTPGEVRAQFALFVSELKNNNPDLELDWEMYGSVPGGTTSQENWIVQSGYRAWEYVEEKEHPTPDYLAGQTDGAALRRFGIPTIRIGWPWPADGSPLPTAEGLGGMGATYIPDLMPCARKIMYVLIDTLTRKREELDLCNMEVGGKGSSGS